MDDLQRENARLRQELELCMQERDRLRALQPFRRGLEGARFIADLVGGTLTATNARPDVITKSGKHLEVKLAKLRTRVPGKKTKGWAWRYLLGEDGKKTYHRLILLGPVDERFRKPTDGKYVIFDIPYADVVELLPNPNYEHRSDQGILENICHIVSAVSHHRERHKKKLPTDLTRRCSERLPAA